MVCVCLYLVQDGTLRVVGLSCASLCLCSHQHHIVALRAKLKHGYFWLLSNLSMIGASHSGMTWIHFILTRPLCWKAGLMFSLSCSPMGWNSTSFQMDGMLKLIFFLILQEDAKPSVRPLGLVDCGKEEG